MCVHIMYNIANGSVRKCMHVYVYVYVHVSLHTYICVIIPVCVFLGVYFTGLVNLVQLWTHS